MLVPQLTLTACGLLLAGVQALPNPVAAPAPAETLKLPDGSIVILGDPTSSTHIGKRDPQISIGEPSTGIIWDKPATASLQIDPKEKRDPQISIGDPSTGIIWDQPAPAPIQIDPKEKRDPQLSIGTPTTGIIWDKPVTVPIQIDPKEKRVPQVLGSPSATITWETGVASATSTFTTSTTTTSSITWATSAPPAPGCGCADDAIPGKYCGYCSQITGSWISWNAYNCAPDGTCKSLGFNQACVNGTPKQCPSVIIDS